MPKRGDKYTPVSIRVKRAMKKAKTATGKRKGVTILKFWPGELYPTSVGEMKPSPTDGTVSVDVSFDYKGWDGSILNKAIEGKHEISFVGTEVKGVTADASYSSKKHITTEFKPIVKSAKELIVPGEVFFTDIYTPSQALKDQFDKVMARGWDVPTVELKPEISSD